MSGKYVNKTDGTFNHGKWIRENSENINERLSSQAFSKMDGLHHVRNMKSALNFLEDIALDLQNEGFELDEIQEFFVLKLERRFKFMKAKAR